MVATQGMLGYGTVSVFGAIPAEIFQGKQYGRIYGTLSIAGSLGGATGPWVTGLLFDRTGSYTIAFWWAMLFACVSIGSMWIAGQVERLAASRAVARQAETT
jgi:nitrate/nitrite transporter NarK